jgi:hypothetical protein
MFAGIQALIDQGLAARGLPASQGNAAPTLYALAAQEYGGASGAAPSTLAQCDADNGAQGTGQCVFHNVTRGGNSTNCQHGTETISINGVPVETSTVVTPDCYIYQPNVAILETNGATVTTGVLNFGLTSTSTTQYNDNTAAFPAKAGWSFANGLGSVDANNLLKAWKAFVHAP